MKINGKNIVITGAASGIGLYIIRTLSKQYSCNLCAVGRNSAKLAALKRELPQVFTVTCDLKDQEEIDRMMEILFTKSPAWSGQVDLFFSNAGYAYYERLVSEDYGHYDDIFSLNVLAPCYILSRLTAYQHGRPFHFVITASGLSRMPIPGYTLYSSTKFALDGFVRAYQHEKPDNLILSAIYPAAVKTPFYRNSPREMKIPLLRQNIKSNTKQILKGVEKNRKYIYPSKWYQLFLIFRRILPLTSLYAFIEKRRLISWSAENKNR